MISYLYAPWIEEFLPREVRKEAAWVGSKKLSTGLTRYFILDKDKKVIYSFDD